MIPAIEHLGLIDEDQLDLGAAALELAALDHGDADLKPWQDLLGHMVERFAQQALEGGSIESQAGVLAHVMASDFGFTGDRETYDDPANADLIEVLKRRRGLPVALALLYVTVARRAGWAAWVLDTPRHALAAIGRRSLAVIDPFADGALVADTKRGAELSALGPMSNRAVLVRLLMNQASRAVRVQNFRRALTIVERVTTTAPAYSPGWWEQARLELATGSPGAARLSLNSMLETTQETAVRRQVLEALRSLSASS